MTRILDTTPAFEAFAAAAFLEPPSIRQSLWRKHYEGAHPAVVAALREQAGSLDSLPALVGQVSKLRRRVKAAAGFVTDLIEQVEPGVRAAMELADGEDPLHVLMVGTFDVNTFVAPLQDDLAVFHCLEWYADEEPTRVLVAHEDAHALHQLALGAPPAPIDGDAAWTLFAEGLAIQVSRTVAADRPEEDYFWYGIEGFDDWVGWCTEHRAALRTRFKEAIEDPETGEAFFGAGFIEDHWRVGYYLADDIVAGLGLSLPQLARLSQDEACAAVLKALDND